MLPRAVAPTSTSKTKTETLEGSTGPLIEVPYGWQGWAGHIDENGELLGVAATTPNMISPHILRPAPLTLHSTVLPLYQSPPHRRMTGGETMEEGEGGEEECPVPNQVKFVNATVEILQNQIKKDEAPKKKRTRTTPDQLRILQKAFSTDPMPNSSARLTLAKKLGMNARAVQVWFQNRRAKEKLEAKRAETGTIGSVPRERASLPGNLPSSKGAHPFAAASAIAPLAINSLRNQRSGLEEDPHAVYDLGMYFCDPSLAQYATGFDLGAYSLVDSLSPQQQQLFDDFDANAAGSEATSATESGEHDIIPSTHVSSYTRFQSMPVCTLGSFGLQTDSTPAISSGGENSLGILFDANAIQEGGMFPAKEYPQRSNSIDVLGIMGDAAASMEGKIFSTPAAREAFITVPLGQSIPIPAKQRSHSVPDLGSCMAHLRGTAPPPIGTEIPPLFRSGELLAIKEEELSMSGLNGAIDTPVASKRGSTAGLAPSSLLEPFPGIVGVGMDDIQAYLDGMSTSI